jgi:hypothetical protein
LLKWGLAVAAPPRWHDCLLDYRQEVWLVVQIHSLVEFFGGRGEVETGWLLENAMLLCRMGPIHIRVAHPRHLGHTSNDPIRSR